MGYSAIGYDKFEKEYGFFCAYSSKEKLIEDIKKDKNIVKIKISESDNKIILNDLNKSKPNRAIFNTKLNKFETYRK